MYRVLLRNSHHGKRVAVLSPTPYPDETWKWLVMEAWDEAFDGHYGPARRRLNRVKRELCGIQGCKCRFHLHRKRFAERDIA